MRLRVVALVVGLVVGLGVPVAGPARADENHPPIAVDDPSIGSPSACNPIDHWGGAFAIIEDVRTPSAGDGYEDSFWVFGACEPMANDSDPDGDPLTLELVGQPAHGHATWFSLDGASVLGYRPDADFFTLPGDQPGGAWISDEVRYRVTDGQAWSNVASFRFWVAPINDPPTFVPGAALVEADVNGPAVSVPWASGIDPGPYESYQSVSFEVATDTRNAPVMFAVPPAIDSDGVLTFTPGNGPGLATVTVTARDDGGLEDWDAGSSLGELPDDSSEPVTFEILVSGPGAVDDDVTVDLVGSFVDVLANDNDGEGGLGTLTIVAVTEGELGRVEAKQDGIVYWPDQGAAGEDAFTYTVEDSAGRRSTAMVHVTLGTIDVGAVDDEATTDEDSGWLVHVLANDKDGGGGEGSLTIVEVTDGELGSVEIVDDVVIYWPEPDATGEDFFTYTITDAAGHRWTATVYVTITAINDAPVATDDEIGVDEGAGSTAVDVLDNDTDIDGDVLVIAAAGPAGHGTVELASGALSYRPDPGFSGSDTFDYTVVDGHGGSDTATVSVIVQTDAEPPAVAARAVAIAGSSIGRSTVRLRFRWSASDDGSGVESQVVQQRRPSGSWRVAERPAPGTGSIVAATKPGHVEAWRVRATDQRGNIGPWATWPEVTAALRQETAPSIDWAGRWKRGEARASSGGASRWTSARGRRASLEVRARAFAWVGRRGADGGRAEVWIDGAKVATVDTDASRTRHRAVLFRVAWPDRGRHRIEIRTLGGGRVDVDAFVIVK